MGMTSDRGGCARLRGRRGPSFLGRPCGGLNYIQPPLEMRSSNSRTQLTRNMPHIGSGSKTHSVGAILSSIDAAIGVLRTLDFPYPISDNAVNFCSRSLTEKDFSPFFPEAEVIAFYSICDGINLPDVHNGYFIHPLKKFTMAQSHLIALNEDNTKISEFFVVGSTGGGNLIAIEQTTNSTYLLPNNRIENGLYFSSTASPIRIISRNYAGFLNLLHADIVAFCEEKAGHRFIDSR
jgi:hypothetical protein